MYRWIFLAFASLTLGCGIDPFDTLGVDTIDSLDSLDPPSTEPVQTDFCWAFDPPPYQVPAELFEQLCLEYPFSWECGCEDNNKLQPCLEFLQGLVDGCGHQQSSCSYRICSQALQAAPCGEWPDECQTVVMCGTPQKPPPPEPSPTSTGEEPVEVCTETAGETSEGGTGTTGPIEN